MEYEKIKHLKISDLDKSRLNDWIEEEVENLAYDFGQNIEDRLASHILHRLRDKLTTAYRSWYVGDVHAVFQTGLAGGYGAAHKVTVKTLFHFLKAGQNQKAHMKASIAEAEDKRKDFIPKKDGKIETEFLIWATKNMISVNHIDPEHDPLKTKRVSPKIMALAEEYQQAKEMDLLNAFKSRLKGNGNDSNL